MTETASRILAIDYGLKRIGLALSDELKFIGSPLETLKSEAKIEETVLLIAKRISELENEKQCKIERVVIGLPLHMDGRVGLMADEVKLVQSKLEPLLNCPVTLWDERLTTVIAERSLREGSMSRKKRTKYVDQVSAALILQSFLESDQRST